MVSLAVASFGPYVAGGMRTEQILVYGAVLLTLPFTFPFLQVRNGMRFLLPWILYLAVASVSVVSPYRGNAPYAAGSLLAGLDNVMLPLAIVLLIWTLVRLEHAVSALQSFCKAVALLAAANGAIAIAGVQFDLTPMLRPFWIGGEGGTVAEAAATMGRLGGVFNQPVEAGVMYGIGGIAAVYVWQHRVVLVTVLLSLITLGGLLSVSKAFILGALPFVLVYWLWSQRGHRRTVTIFVGLFAVLAVLQSGLFEEWTGTNYLTRLLNPTGGIVEFYSAGRFTDQSVFMNVVEGALSTSPLIGVGPAGWRVPYDAYIAEALVVAGVLGLALYSAVLLALVSLRKTGGEEGRFALFFAAIVIAGSFGFSPLTANRVATVAWVIISLLVLARTARENAAIEPEAASIAAPSALISHDGSARATRPRPAVP